MTQSSHNDAARIARSLLSLGPAQRRQAIEHACAGDRTLQVLVERLVQQQESATLASGHEAQAAAAADPAVVGRRVGSYTILRVLGEGGMGTVYLAEQDRPRRIVALKVVRPGLMSPRLIRRFEVESLALARLHHPGIAQIYESATADSGHGAQPFYAMEYVEGATLTAHAQNLPTRQRIVLFLKVCEAVQHAHQKGVIHRDLKPMNILVEATGQPKILDFGIARLTDDRTQMTAQTEAGQILGTLAYMSPEQVGGDPSAVDTRADVYALGVILYEMLSGTVPHAVSSASVPEAIRIIMQDEPTAIGDIDRSLRGDLQTIVAKAMEKDRSRRYATASELAADLRRFLDNQPILARPPSRIYQLRKFTARNRALVGGASLAVVALVGGAAATTWQAIEATRGRTRAELAQGEARTEAANAKAVADFLTGMLAAANPDIEGEREVSVREMVDRAAEQLNLKPIDNPRVDMTIREVLATTYRGIGHAKEAEPHARNVLRAAREVFGDDSINTIAARRNLANLLAELGRYEEAEPMQRECQDWLDRHLGPDHVESALCRGEMGSLYFQRGMYQESEKCLRESLRIVRPILGDSNHDVLTNMDHLGSVLTQLGRFDEAEAQLKETLAARERTYGPEHAMVAFTLNSLANVVQKQGRNEQAIELLKRALAIRRKRLEPTHPSLIINVQNLAVALAAMKKYEEAEPLLRECLKLQSAKLGPDHPKTLVIMSNLAYVVQDLGKLDEAESLYRGVVDGHERTKREEPQTWIDMNNLAMLVQERGRLEEAAGIYADIMHRCDGKLPAGHYVPAIIQNNYGDCLTALKRFDEAEKALLASQDVLTKFFKPGHTRVTKGVDRLAKLYDAWGKPDKVAEYRPAAPGK